MSKCHVKLAELCAIIQAFDFTNVFLTSSTSANTSTFPLCLAKDYSAPQCYIQHSSLLVALCTSTGIETDTERQKHEVKSNRKKKNERKDMEQKGKREKLGTYISFAIWLCCLN